MSSSSEDAAVSELARRILRSSGVKIIHDGSLTHEIEKLSVELSDSAPKIIFGIKSKISDTDDILFLMENSGDGVISLHPPSSYELVWVRKEKETWMNLTKNIIELGRAGYPGCIGCAGPAAEEPWDEKKSRKRKT
jgi:hypothetical protein